MMTDSQSEKRGSDWIDIIWASYENAFVNAKLYYALTLWADVEKQLKDTEKANFYSGFAAGLKKSFNKSTEEGGFWNNKNKWYIHWIDKNKSPHGDNLVVPVILWPSYMAFATTLPDGKPYLIKLKIKTRRENLSSGQFAYILMQSEKEMTGSSPSRIMKMVTFSFHGVA